jgi:hypothetical protein
MQNIKNRAGNPPQAIPNIANPSILGSSQRKGSDQIMSEPVVAPISKAADNGKKDQI